MVRTFKKKKAEHIDKIKGLSETVP